MLRKITVALLFFVGSFAGAVDADFSGEFRVRTNTDVFDPGSSSAENLVSTLQDQFNVRTKISASLRPSEAFEGMVTSYANVGGSEEGDAVLAGKANWMISDRYMLQAGRTTYQIGRGEVIGTNNYAAIPTLFDVLVFNANIESANFDLGFLQKVKGSGSAVEKVEGDDKGLERYFLASIDLQSLPEWAKMVNIHAIAPTNDVKEARAGLSLGGSLGRVGVGYKVTAASSMVKNLMDQAMLDGYLSYTYEWGQSRAMVYLGAHHEMGDYDAFNYSKHPYAGKMDVAKWGSGLGYLNAGAAYMINSDSKIGVKGYYFNKGNESVSEEDIEVDLYFKHSMGSSLALTIWGGMLKSGDDSQTKAEANLSMKF